MMTFHLTGLKISGLSEQFVLQSLEFIFNSLETRTITSDRKSLTVTFLSEKSIKELNFRFLGKNKPTDVLSFSPTEEDSLGELAIYCDSKRAAHQGLTAEEEVFYLLAHGILHLLGYNHENGGKEAKQMYSIQDDIFQEWTLKRDT